jgi:hypothetical protein
MSELETEYDTPWKDALERYFEEFIAFFFPQAHGDIDWTQGYEFLDKELQQVVRDAELGKRLVDKLVKIYRTGSEETWVLVHIEVQSQEESHFAQRMYVYHYHIFDRYKRSIASLAVLGDERATWRPNQFSDELWGCEVRFRFPVVKLLDYEQRWQELEASRNPFATVVMAHLKAQETRNDARECFSSKLYLTRRLYEQGYEREDVEQLKAIISGLLTTVNTLDELRQLYQPMTLDESEED